MMPLLGVEAGPALLVMMREVLSSGSVGYPPAEDLNGLAGTTDG